MRKTIRLNISILFAIAFIGMGWGQTRPQAKSAPSRPGAPFLQYVKTYEETTYVTKVVLKNGMTVLVDEFKVQPVVSMQMHIRAGAFDDPAQTPGTAQLVRSIVQRGMPDKTGGSYSQKAQSLGGIIRSTTDYASSVFEIVAPSVQWKRALQIHAEAIQNPSFDAGNIKIESKIIRAEARRNLDLPRRYAMDKLLETAFDQPRMALNIPVSRKDALENISAESLSSFYRNYYVPSRMMLVVSGDISSSEILNEVVRLYTKPASASVKSSLPPIGASQNEFRFSSIHGNVAVPHLLFGFRTVPADDQDSKALEVLNAILGTGEASVLSSRIRDEKKLALSSNSELLATPDFGFLTIHSMVNPGDIDRIEIAVLSELELLKREEPTESDMERSFAQLEREHWERIETVTGKAQALAHFESLGDWKRLDRWISDIRKVKPADVKRVAGKYLQLQNCSLLELLPSSSEDRPLKAEGVRNTFSSLLDAAANEEQEKRNKQTVLAVKIPSPASFRFNEVRFPFHTASILRGPDLFIREDHSNALIEMGLFFPGGKLDEKRENAGITKLMMSLLLKESGESRLPYRQLEIYGGSVRPVVTDDYFGVYLSTLSQNFEPAFKLLLQAIREPLFDEEGVKRQKEILIAEIRSQKLTNKSAETLMRQALFEGFPYSADNAGTEEGLASVSLEMLQNWYASRVKNKKPIIAMIGDTKGTSLASIFVQYFSGSRIQDLKIPDGFAKALDKGRSVTQDWNGSESLILVGFQAPPIDDEDAYGAYVLKAYSGNPGKLPQELKDRSGVAHCVSVEYDPHLRGGNMTVLAAVAPGTEEGALKALREEIQKVHDGPVPYRDFRSAVSEAVGSRLIRNQARWTQINALTEQVLAGKGLEGYENYSAGLQDIREEDLKAIASRIFDMNKAVVLVLRGRN